jgi:hypothetical protein
MKISDNISCSPTPTFKCSPHVPFEDARFSKEGIPSPPTVNEISKLSLTWRSTSLGKDFLPQLNTEQCSDIPTDLEDILTACIPACMLEDYGEDSTPLVRSFTFAWCATCSAFVYAVQCSDAPTFEALSLMVPSFRLLNDE